MNDDSMLHGFIL